MQRADCPPRRGPDDFHSPVKPHEYVELRLLPAADFFRGRIPRAAKLRFRMQIFIILCSAISAVITGGQPAAYVAVVTVIAGSLTSWLEFADLGGKVERCWVKNIAKEHDEHDNVFNKFQPEKRYTVM